ncbi:MAG: putative AAA+ superfamily ATPase [Candidatus Omnitrophota bacterium]|jgi:predicted AAA+ superfamily ATPase
MNRIYELKRHLKLEFPQNPIKGSGAIFLWGPRQTGKTTFLQGHYKDAHYYDLLDSSLIGEFTIRPQTLREEVLADNRNIVIIDEIQKAPALINEVHWLLENTNKKIILCGSSARKLKRDAHNLLGGRAIDAHLFPFVSSEIPDIDLDRFLNHGGLPAHYLNDNPRKLMKAYINNYIKEEILEESITRNIPAFSRFLEITGLTHGQLLNYANIAREAGVSPITVRNYYQILIDTLLGFTLEPWRRTKKRRLVETAKFYIFDIGIAHYLNPEITSVMPGTDIYGRAFEHFLINEIRAYLSYHDLDIPLSFWRTSSGFEVDLILGDMEVAIEFKSSTRVTSNDLKGIRALQDEHQVKRCIIVSREEKPRLANNIEIMSWKKFCSLLWSQEVI